MRKAVLAGLFWLFLPGYAAAENADAEFFRGKTVTFIVATAPGGGYDTYGRLLTRFMAKHMPGTRFLVRNIPGAGNIIGTNTIYAARPDGLTFGMFNTGLLYNQMLDLQGIRFDLGKMSWIGKMAREGRTLVLARRSGMERIEDLLAAKETVRLASSGVGGASHIETRMLKVMMGLNIRLIENIEGGETQLSMLRGEVAGALETTSSNLEFVKRGDGRFVLSLSGGSDLPDVPKARSFITNPQHLRMLDLVAMMGDVGRPAAGPPGIPAGRLQVLREAFEKTVADPDLLAAAERIKVPIEPASGEEVAATVTKILAQPPEIIAMLRDANSGD